MTFPFLYHGQSEFWVQRQQGSLTLTLATSAQDQYDHIYVRHEPDNEEYLVEMSVLKETSTLIYWQATIALNTDSDLTHYSFKAMVGIQQFWLTGQGINRRIPSRVYHFKYNAAHQPPNWVKSQIFYQIFPDRFANGKPEISVKSGEYQLLSGKPSLQKAWEEPVGGHDNSGASEFYGGDLFGVEQKIEYLQQLGVTALYLNPIFSAPSNHKYDTTDYYHVDSHLGGNEQFASLCTTVHQRGMKVMLDAVFNHTSTEHPWFDKPGKQTTAGAYQSPSSPYRDYYFFEGDTNHYIGWKGIDSLPVLNFQNQQVRDTIYQSDDSVIKHWLRAPYHVDGWRFDVIHMLGEGSGAKNNAHYVKAFRHSAKQVNPDCYILGEHFFEATQWLQGDQEDGSMNYFGFAHPLRALLANIDVSWDPIEIDVGEFCTWLDQARASIPWQNQLAQLNQLDSHDTRRFMTMVNGDKARFHIAAAFLFTYVGTPCLYYGTEVGLEGSDDPDNRRCMPWHQLETSEHLPFFQRLMTLRKHCAALQQGDFQWLNQSSQGIVFARHLGSQMVVFAMNVSQSPATFRAPIWQTGSELNQFYDFTDGVPMTVCDGELTITIDAQQFRILTSHPFYG
ncbi:maltodextrin glucosidase [Vibrio olivae]|uniref:Maltodextrin glucosidase n=1 Tax=Vibrio olivae TaxID=1243002 RepID=A0ABV5HNF3_9VIBR